MQYNIYFDICALFILITIAVTSMSRRGVPSYRQRAYSALYFAIFMATLCERIETYLQMHPFIFSEYSILEKISGSAFFFFHLGSAVFYLLYIMSVLDIYVPITTWKGFWFLWFGYIICAVLLVINWFVPIMFSYSVDGIYHRGKYLFLFYIIATYYLAVSLVLLLKYNNLMRRKTKVVVASYVLFVLVGILIQYFYPTLLIENFCNTISVTFIYITLQNPSEMVDEVLDILNKKAFLEGNDLKTKRKAEHYTIFLTISNVRALSDEIGYGKGQDALKTIAKYLKSVGQKELHLITYAYRYSEYVFALTVHTDDAEKAKALMYKISFRMREPWNVGNMKLKVDGHLFLLHYPKHYETTADLINKIEMMVNNVADDHELIIDVDKVDFDEIKRQSDYDNLARMNIDNKMATIKFQPFLSKIYKINYCADVFCFLHDMSGNEIDMRGKFPDIRVTQALMDMDEFVFRRACRALSFWNAGDKNGKYRAVVSMSQGEISRNDFIKRIKKILREENAMATWVSIKLTETTISTMNSVAERNIKMLGDIKSSIIVDKFGSGYGDLNRVLSLPVSQINIDSSILRSAMESEKMMLVAQGIVNLFHDISIFVCATDIENEMDKKMAEDLGCDYLIGDYMGVPMKDSSYVKFIDAYFEEN
ncbi:EAL domain, c-di-GMP-specific phosphodiesterase class I (or its enzymatically inactive variant) [Butyrivibrio proteoclasticus]|uniref:EAL domain, c-di-GMP-specific phosphodiesterase class I (Or its enzymatically inactive variant) n=1 Tax=Butyrivibrio proteoclasticus TaxID=43305 RepID=A0A1I5RJA2_9FIRM|nr:EAL domain-containing protein [Butyrivibrio proteoclasticus]SFP58602.1 EAL domain, c-di-GMP-specific phosphodiesterase class I (or its enzymatically inactive variant) [Butyrivibrio proteoclasticus]